MLANIFGPDVIIVVILAILFFGGYLLPTIIAIVRGHHQAGAIIAVNVLLGWSIAGWIVALVWALSAVRPPSTTVIQHNR